MITVEKFEGQIIPGDEVCKQLEYAYGAGLDTLPDDIRAKAVEDLCGDVSAAIDNDYGIWLGREDGAITGFFILHRPAIGPASISPYSTNPYVAMFYNSGGPAMRSALIAAVGSAVKAVGARQYIALNTEYENDDAWVKVFQEAGTPQRAATLFIFDVP